MNCRARFAVLGSVLLLALVAAAAGLHAAAAGAARRSWNLDIDRALDAAGVKAGMVVGEAGAGDGYFTLPMARRVGPAGRVYANDISRRALDRLAASAAGDGLRNVETVIGGVDDPRFPRRDLQLIVIVHAFHDFDKPVEWLVNARAYLRPGGAVVIVDRDPSASGEAHFWPRERIEGYARAAGFEVSAAHDLPTAHLVIVLTPAPGLTRERS